MKYGNVPGVNKPVSRLVQGTMMISSKDPDHAYALLDSVFEKGGSTFDTAILYGTEGILGDWIRDRNLREQVVILTKGAHPRDGINRVTPNDITDDLNGSLAGLQVDSIDLYLLHRDDESVEVGPIVEILNEHTRAGKIRAFGGSNWTHERIREANRYANDHGLTPFAMTSPAYSLAEQYEPPWRGCTSISGRQGEAAREYFAAEQIAVFTWSTLASGFFSGRITRENYQEIEGWWNEICRRCYCQEPNFVRKARAAELAARKGATVPQIALAYALCQPLNLFALVGCATGEEFAENAEAVEIDLSERELAYLDLRAESPE